MKIIINKTSISIILLIVFVLNSSINAKEINYKTAEQVAINAFVLHSGININELNIIEVIPFTDTKYVVFYIFNFEQGHIVISADDIVEPVLGYGLHSNISLSKLPSGLSYLLNHFKKEISFARYNVKTTRTSTSFLGKWDYYLNLDEQTALLSYSPGNYLLETKWGQLRGYQKFCPTPPNSTLKCSVGCGGVALGQILKYWDCRVFPDNSLTYTSYTINETISVNFYDQNYDWPNMELFTADDENALLLYHSAVALRSDFCSNGTNTSSIPQLAVTALTSYFGFNAIFKDKNNYTLNTWISMLKSDIDMERPIFYAGYDVNNEQTLGHGWVIDGYNTNNYFHCNWGWYGDYNDWYLLTALEPGTSQFNDGQEAILNIYPLLDACSGLSGSNVICTSNTSYSISYPSSASAIWTKSSNLIQDGGNIGTIYTVRAASSSQSETGFIKATIFNSQGQVFLVRNKNLWTGKPKFTVEGDEIVGVLEPGVASIDYNFAQGITNVDWTCSDAISSVTGGLVAAKFKAGSQAGYGSVYANATNLCGSKEEMLLVEVTGWNSVYPNPAIDQLKIDIDLDKISEELQSKPVEISLYDKSMSLRKHIKTNGSQFTLNISDLKPDVYFLQIRIGDKTHSEKIIVNHK